MSAVIVSKMENIQSIFRRAQDNASKLENINELITQLETTEKEFLSLAYEGAAFELASKDLSKGDTIPTWSAFLNVSQKHAAQIHIGLGWAIAKEKRNSLPFLNELDTKMLFRIWDGCGYFDGIFRQRQTIKGQNRLEYIQEKDYLAYDIGIGRSLWYICKGDETKILEWVQLFPENRHSYLWIGIGIACSYAGGFEEKTLKSMMTYAGQYKTQLGIGAAMTANSRIHADCNTKDIELACDVFNNISATEAMKIVEKNKTMPNISFNNFILQMEQDLKF